jgi:hypothetical protein
MKACTCLPVASLVVLLSGVVLAQDPVKVDSSHYKVLFENAGVRVLKISYRPGEKSTMHQHPDSLAIVLAPSTISFETPDGKTEERELPGIRNLHAGCHSPAGKRRDNTDGGNPRRVQDGRSRHGHAADVATGHGDESTCRRPACDGLPHHRRTDVR